MSEEPTCENCTKTDFCTNKEDGPCINHRLKETKTDDPLGNMDMPSIVASNWADDPCVDPAVIVEPLSGPQTIGEIEQGINVLSHKGFHEVTDVYSRQFNGEMVGITPFYSNIVTPLTPNHPVPAIKTVKECPVNPNRHSFRVCLSSCSSKNDVSCKRYFESYKVQLLNASELERGDIILYPRNTGIVNIDALAINLYNYADPKKSFELGDKLYCSSYFKMNNDMIRQFETLFKNNTSPKLIQKQLGISDWTYRTWVHRLKLDDVKMADYEKLPEKQGVFPRTIKINEDFCSLAGYFVSEGDAHDHQTRFSFNKDEIEEITEIKHLVSKIFSRKCFTVTNGQVTRIVVNGVPIAQMMRTLFGTVCETKHLPSWFISLPEKMLHAFTRTYFRGDGHRKATGRHGVTATTVAPKLPFQLQLILHKLGYHCGIFYHKSNDATPHYIEGRLIKNLHDKYAIQVASKTSVNLLESMGGVVSSPCHRRPYGWVDEYYVYTCIRETIRFPYLGVVKNLGVKDANTYTVNGFIVHNCNRPC